MYGSIEWKAPEIIEDCKAHTNMSDVWAFGVLMYELYTRGNTFDEFDLRFTIVSTFTTLGHTGAIACTTEKDRLRLKVTH